MAGEPWLNDLKIMCREKDYPYFDDKELEFYYEKNNKDLYATAYECLVIKAESSGIRVSGLTTADTSVYFLRLAAQYRPSNSGTLKGVF